MFATCIAGLLTSLMLGFPAAATEDLRTVSRLLEARGVKDIPADTSARDWLKGVKRQEVAANPRPTLLELHIDEILDAK